MLHSRVTSSLYLRIQIDRTEDKFESNVIQRLRKTRTEWVWDSIAIWIGIISCDPVRSFEVKNNMK